MAQINLETILVILLAFCVSCEAISLLDVINAEWNAFKSMHNKEYPNESEEIYRRKVYLENKARIARHNIEASNGNKSFYLKMNQFGDMFRDEFVNLMNGYDHGSYSKSPNSAFFLEPAFDVQYPKNKDWRDEGAVTGVKNQGHCGSCWSFSATGALEGQNFRKTGKLVSLSEQNLIDCSVSYDNHGCNGGLMDNAYRYIRDNHGIDTEESYPYEGEQEECRYRKSDKGATEVGFTDIEEGNEAALKKAVASVGPVSVAIDAGQESFQFYSHGVYSDGGCSSFKLDHGVLVVGYGVDEETSEEYWIVKNSWGPRWGEGGYIKMARNKNNMCGIATRASYPNV